jgi:hypothetical protein
MPEESEIVESGSAPAESVWVHPSNSKIDVILPDGTHRYWSTWCRHGLHGPCGESRHIKTWASDGTPEELYDTPREPAQCKTCSAPCICPCHEKGSTGGDQTREPRDAARPA